MRTSRIVTFASVFAIAALLSGAAVFFATNTDYVAASPAAAAPDATTSLEPIVVVATR